MKPAPFEYADPTTVDDALTLLRDRGDEAKILAGGQSLVPLLNMRLALPEVVVDINRVGGLDSMEANDVLTIGALVRQHDVERATHLAAKFPLLTEAIQWVGHPQIRNRGTVLGSIAHADPAAELPVVFQALEAEMEIVRLGETRTVSALEFFVHIMTTAVEPDEMLIQARLRDLPPGTGSAFLEVARRHGDFAVASAAVVLTLDEGVCTKARIALGGVAPIPLRALRAEEFLVGQRAAYDTYAEAGKQASAESEPASDIHGTAEYRRELVAVLVRRALETAAGRADERGEG